MFLDTAKKKYAKEAALLICKLKADFPRHIAYIATHNRTVKMTGKPGHGKPMDQLMQLVSAIANNHYKHTFPSTKLLNKY